MNVEKPLNLDYNMTLNTDHILAHLLLPPTFLPLFSQEFVLDNQIDKKSHEGGRVEDE